MQGGMGSISHCLAVNAKTFGDRVDIFVGQEVDEIKLAESGELKSTGVLLKNGGKFIECKTVLSNCTPHVTFNKLLRNYNMMQHEDNKVAAFFKRVQNLNYESGTMKINLAVDRLPNFKV